jgi:hypothetical protein
VRITLAAGVAVEISACKRLLIPSKIAGITSRGQIKRIIVDFITIIGLLFIYSEEANLIKLTNDL